jgi:hypothetical protein
MDADGAARIYPFHYLKFRAWREEDFFLAGVCRDELNVLAAQALDLESREGPFPAPWGVNKEAFRW